MRESTRDLYEKYTVYWLGEWSRTADLTDSSIAAYQRKRLREVTRKATNNELSALRKFVSWLAETGMIAEAPTVPTASPGINGTPHHQRRRVKAPELSSAEIEALLAALPDRAARGHPVRARFVVMFETTLRPATLDVLRVPENWAPGETTIRIRPGDDKEAYAREVPLTPRAVDALKSVAPDDGLIFGQHRYHEYLRTAASSALPAAKAKVFTGQHVRSASITRWLESSGNLPGVQHLAGHRHASTTGRYVRPTFRAALEVIQGRDQGKRPAPRKKTPKKTGT